MFKSVYCNNADLDVHRRIAGHCCMPHPVLQYRCILAAFSENITREITHTTLQIMHNWQAIEFLQQFAMGKICLVIQTGKRLYKMFAQLHAFEYFIMTTTTSFSSVSITVQEFIQ